jgi:ketosteroid isomerase-like protein
VKPPSPSSLRSAAILRPVSEKNAEVVRRSFAALERAFHSYWANPRSIAAGMEAGDWPEWEEALDYVHPEVEWRTVFSARPSTAAWR